VTLASLASFAACAAGVYITMTVRAMIRSKYNILPVCCGAADDCCCAFFCAPLAQCQLFRFLGTVENRNYRFASTDGIAV